MSESATSAPALDATAIAELADRVAHQGHEVTPSEALALLQVEPGSDAYAALMTGASTIRDAQVGREVRFCSILNAKAGNCSEDCGYCSQAMGSANDDYTKHKWLDDEDIAVAAESAAENGALALGLVAAWKGVKRGPQLDMVCESIKKLADQDIRPDASLGILDDQQSAEQLRDAGLAVYHHNLETARSHFDKTCTTHSFEERWQTIQHVKAAGLNLCSGGILGMGESLEQRVEFGEQLRFIEPNMIPINFLDPLDGTAMSDRQPLEADEALIALAMLRFMLPAQNLMVAGGKETTFGERLDEVFEAGINAVMVGNYLTSLGTPPEFWYDTAAAKGIQVVEDKGEHGCCSKKGC